MKISGMDSPSTGELIRYTAKIININIGLKNLNYQISVAMEFVFNCPQFWGLITPTKINLYVK